MLIDRADRVVNLCEMKFSQDDFAISKDYDERLRRKIVRLQEETGGKRNVQVTLVTTFGLKKNMYISRVQRVVTLEGLFLYSLVNCLTDYTDYTDNARRWRALPDDKVI